MRIAPLGTAVLSVALAFTICGRAKASAPAGSKAYVTNTADDTVSVVDVATMTVLTTIAVGDEPRSPCSTPDGSLVFVPNRLGSQFPASPGKGGPKGVAPTVTLPSVSVIDTATDAVVATIPLTRNGPYDCVTSPDGSTLYVTCNDSDAVSVVDVGTFTETTTISLATSGGNPEGIAITPDGSKLYIAITGDSALRVIDVATNGLVGGEIFVGSQVHDVKVTADGTKVFAVGQGEPHVLLTATDTLSATVFDDIGDQRDVAIFGSTAYVTNSAFLVSMSAKAGPKGISVSPTVDVYDLASETYLRSIPLLSSGPFGIDVLRDGTFVYPVTTGSQDLREVEVAENADTDNGVNVGTAPAGVVVVHPRAIVNSFFLPKKVSYKKNAAAPAKSKFSAGGFFDTGSRVVDLTAAATLTVGTQAIPVPGFTASKNGRTFTYQAGGLKFVIAKNPFGSSRAKFRLTNKGDLGPSVPTDGALTLRFKNAAVDGQCEVALENGGFRIGKKRGSLSKPNLFVVRANGVLGGAGKDAFGVIVGLATNGQTPPAAQEVRVEFGSTLKATIPAGSFTRKGEQDVFKGNVNGVTDVTVDYLRETVTIFGKDATLGAFVEGQNPITIFVGVGAEDRGVAVRIARDGKLLKY